MNYWDNLLETDEHAANYMETYGEGVGALTRHELGKFINDGESVLDVGCGPGWNFEHFLEYGPEVEYKGLDYSERFVRVSNQRILDKGLARDGEDTFQLGDVRDIPEPNKSWDVVIFQDVLEHTNGYEKPISEALRVARKRVIVTFWHLVQNDEHINDDGNDGWGAWYEQGKWEKFLDSLNLHWLHHQFFFPENRQRDFYIIDLGVEHGL